MDEEKTKKVKDLAIPIGLIVSLLGGSGSFIYTGSKLEVISEQNTRQIQLLQNDIQKVEDETENKIRLLSLDTTKKFENQKQDYNAKYSEIMNEIKHMNQNSQELRIRMWDILNELRAVVYRMEGRMSSDDSIVKKGILPKK